MSARELREEVGIALVGLGRAGTFHRESLRELPGARLRAVYDTDRARAERVAAEERCLAAREAQQALDAEGVDAVVVATPTRTHFGYVMAALEAGRSVLSEKPLGTCLEEIDTCFGRAREANLPLLVAYQRRFDPSFAAVIEAAHDGAAGELQFVRSVSRDNPVPSLDYLRTSCGIFHDCVVHDLDLVCQIARAAPSEVFAFGSSFLPEIAALGDHDNVAIALRFESGLLGSIDVNRRSVYGYDQRVEVFGSAGMLETGNRPRTSMSRASQDGLWRPPVDHSFPTRYRDAYRLELACFLDCVRGERTPPVTHAQVRLNHRLAEAAERSCREGRPVRIEAEPGAGPAPGLW